MVGLLRLVRVQRQSAPVIITILVGLVVIIILVRVLGRLADVG